MRAFLRNARIRTKLAALLCLALLSTGLVVGIGLGQIRVIGKELREITNESLPLAKTLNAVAFHHVEQMRHVERAVGFGTRMAGDSAARDDFETERERFVEHDRLLAQEMEKACELLGRACQEYKGTDKGRRLLEVDYQLRDLHTEHADYQFRAERVFNLLAQGKRREAQAEILGITRGHEDEECPMHAALEPLMAAMEGFIGESVAAARRSERAALVGMASVSGLVLLVAMGLAVLISRSITRPLRLAMDVAGRIAEGERKPNIQVRGRDEVGLLLTALQEMSEGVAKAEQALRESQERYRSITNDVLDSSDVGIFILDADFKVAWVNRSLERYFGLRREAIIGKDKRTLIRERTQYTFEDPETFANKVFATYDDNTYIENFVCHILPEGNREDRWLEHWSQPIRSGLYAGGRIEHYTDITERKRARREMEDLAKFPGENRFPVLRIARDGTLLYANAASESLLGEWETVIGRPVPDRWRGIVARVLGRGSEETVEVQHADRVLSLMFVPVAQAGYVNVYGRDVTQRKRAEEALRQSRQNLGNVFDTVDDFLFVLDNQARILQVNHAVQARLGYAADELVGKEVLDVHPPDRRDEAVVILANLMAGKTNTCAIPLMAKDGTLIPVETKVCRGKWSGRDALFGICRDVTERKQAEEALKRSETKFRTLFDSSRDPFMTLAPPTWKFTSGNPAALELFGMDSEETFTAKGPWEVSPEFQPDGRPSAEKAKEIIETAMREGSHFFQWTHKRLSGQEFPATVLLTRMELDGQTLLQATIRDVTEQKRAEEALVRSNEELEQFAYVASHDLQEPLRMVSGYVKMLERRYKGQLDDDADDFIHFAVDGAERMATLIADLLAYSRVTRCGKAFEPTDCEAVMDEVLADLEVAVTETGATVTHDPLPTVVADEVQLGRLLRNLIGNAITYHGEAPPKVHVSAEQTGGGWRFAVRDNGIGIEPQYHERIFAVFQRLHARDEYEGTGIGLAVAKKIVERHGGRIWIESEVGTGSTFYFTIPQREVRTDEESSDHPADEVYANAGQTGGGPPG